jgi:LDH2 family malate/lactate/ureidoglycolate dehydrogenase
MCQMATSEANFSELRRAEVQLRRIHLPRTWVNKGPGAEIPAPGNTTSGFFSLLGAGGRRGSALHRPHLIWRHLVYAVLNQGL